MPPNVDNRASLIAVVSLTRSENYCRLGVAVLSGRGDNKSPFFVMMGAASNRHSPGLRKNGDEGSTDAARLAATAVVDRLCPTVSYADGLEASPGGHGQRA
jgi:hypothetical protein